MTATESISSFPDYSFLTTETRPANEQPSSFIHRRLHEELRFFGSLAVPENQKCKIELTNMARKLTRAATAFMSDWLGSASPVVKLPNNIFCFSGAFGYPSTSGITRWITGAAIDDAFITALNNHFDELATCIQVFEQASDDIKEGIALALQNCIEGLNSYITFYRGSKTSEDGELAENYTELCRTLEERCSQFSILIQRLNGNVLPQTILEDSSPAREESPPLSPEESLLPVLPSSSSPELEPPLASQETSSSSSSTICKEDQFPHVHFPTLQSIDKEGITEFVNDYLYQFITGKVSSESVSGSPPKIMDLLREEIQRIHPSTYVDIKEIETWALSAFIKKAALGLFQTAQINAGLPKNILLSALQPLLTNALKQYIPFHFAGMHLESSKCAQIAKSTIIRVWEERNRGYADEMKIHGQPPHNPHRTPAILAKIAHQQATTGSVFLDPTQLSDLPIATRDSVYRMEGTIRSRLSPGASSE